MVAARFAARPAPIRLGMVGGGVDAFIGGVHRIAARLDGEFELVAGALSSTPERARESGAALGLAPDRIYDDFSVMAEAEAARPDGIEAVAIVTPNHMHAAPAAAFLKRGVHVICDKPLAATLQDARALAAAAEAGDALFFLTHNYTGYPMVRQARAMVAEGALGRVRLVQVEYVQDWLTRDPGNKQSGWRTDPARSGAGGAVGDIGTHAFNLATFVTGLELEALAAELTAFVPGRRLDDNAQVMLRFRGGARGMLWASQVAPGNENGLRLRVYGEAGGLEWEQEEPNRLWHAPFGEPRRLLTRGGAGAGPAAAAVTRIPAGHPEGYLEGFATLYREAAAAIRACAEGRAGSGAGARAGGGAGGAGSVGGGGGGAGARAGGGAGGAGSAGGAGGAGSAVGAGGGAGSLADGPAPGILVPGIRDGLAGMAFIDACVRSSAAGAAWVEPAS